MNARSLAPSAKSRQCVRFPSENLLSHPAIVGSLAGWPPLFEQLEDCLLFRRVVVPAPRGAEPDGSALAVAFLGRVPAWLAERWSVWCATMRSPETSMVSISGTGKMAINGGTGIPKLSIRPNEATELCAARRARACAAGPRGLGRGSYLPFDGLTDGALTLGRLRFHR
jgi:hypothetical protein